jgi:cytochrome c-type biogenesis protein CcmH
MKQWFLMLLIVLSFDGSGMDVKRFDDPQKQQRYERLIEELRCLVCQNQSLADSNAPLAQDLRNEVYYIIESGKSDEEATRFLVDRYGDFVLYRPPFRINTTLLWLGPFALLVAGVLLLWRLARRRGVGGPVELSLEERQRLERLRKET